MLIAAGLALLAVLFGVGGGGVSVDIWNKKDAKAARKSVELVVTDDQRTEEILADLKDLTKVEKTASKELTKAYRKIEKLGGKPGTTREDYEEVYTGLDESFAARYRELAETLVDVKSGFTEEEWGRFLAGK